MTQQNYINIALIVMAGATYLIRMLPITFFRKKIENEWVQDFFYYLPYCILAAMTFPSIFSATVPPGGELNTQHIISAVIATQVALIMAWRKHGLVLVALCAMFAALTVEISFGYLLVLIENMG